MSESSYLIGLLIDSALDTWEDQDDEIDLMPEEFADFLLHGANGPKLDKATVGLLSNYGIDDVRTFLLYSR